MADSSPERPQADKDDVLELNNDLEKMTECVENMSVQLTWMAYDLVALRTSPELGALLRGLEEAYHRCRAAVCGDRSQEPELEDRAQI
ncbi:synaptonemal complex central element protein 3 [Hippoglossus stenolepis]|uniref:synaptonemal complex central element protein 3 n=1 Tax=Hippoglossus stenolepis TaxID=195615 RepID=UPI00159C3EB2|nr:synaptonemal complex central element protein 3 [Hippoglossus stenolepis]